MVFWGFIWTMVWGLAAGLVVAFVLNRLFDFFEWTGWVK